MLPITATGSLPSKSFLEVVSGRFVGIGANVFAGIDMVAGNFDQAHVHEPDQVFRPELPSAGQVEVHETAQDLAVISPCDGFGDGLDQDLHLHGQGVVVKFYRIRIHLHGHITNR